MSKLSYREIAAAIEAAPLTYLPGILKRVVQKCQAKKVFRDGGLEKFVTKVQMGHLSILFREIDRDVKELTQDLTDLAAQGTVLREPMAGGQKAAPKDNYESCSQRVLALLLLGLIRLTDKESSQGYWRVVLDYDNEGDVARVAQQSPDGTPQGSQIKVFENSKGELEKKNATLRAALVRMAGVSSHFELLAMKAVILGQPQSDERDAALCGIIALLETE